MPIISTWGIQTGDEFIPAGQVAHLSAEEEKRLVDSGLASWPPAVPEQTEEEIELDTNAKANDLGAGSGTGGNDDDEDEWPTAEEFASAKADRQKELLKEANIEPASNAPERVEQYKTFLQGDPE